MTLKTPEAKVKLHWAEIAHTCFARVNGSTEKNFSHFVVLVQALNGRMVVVAVGRTEVLHQGDPVAAAEVHELDVLESGRKNASVNSVTWWAGMV